MSLLVALALLLAACSSGGDAGSDSDSSDSEDSSEESSEATSGDSSDSEGDLTGSLEIVWPGTSDPEMQVAEEFAAEMADQGIDIEYNFLSWADMQQQLAVRVQADNPPDITFSRASPTR